MPCQASAFLFYLPATINVMNEQKRYVVMTFGSFGDVFPMLGLCEELKRRGQDVAFCSRPGTQHLAEKINIPFISAGDDTIYEENVRNPDIWHPIKASFMVAEKMGELIDPSYAVVRDEFEKHGSDLVIIASMLVLGARLAREQWDFKLVTVHLQPLIFRDTLNPPRFSAYGPDLRKLPQWVNRGIYGVADFLLDGVIRGPLNQWQLEHGIKPVRKRIFIDWVHSPDLVLAMFPDWFAQKSGEWPAASEVAGFPIWDDGQDAGLDAELEAFLSGGDDVVVITPGSANVFGGRFIEVGVEACRKIGKRVLIVTGYPEQVCELDGDREMLRAYVPFDVLFKRVKAVMHHGGIGTTARCLGCGVPQLVMPLAHDQPDNAQRVKDLGVGDWITTRQFTVERVAKRLDNMLGDVGVKSNCEKIADRVSSEDGVKRAVDIICAK